jgi:ParB family chromosome partitioning protein
MSRKPALGKGLKALIPQAVEPAVTERERPPIPPGGKWIREIRIATIMPNPHQPRRSFDEDELRELADSIREHGVLQPLLVTAAGDGYELVSGERRLRASRIAGLQTVPAIEVDPENDVGSLTIALVENVQRQDLGVLELARAYRQLRDDFGRTQEEIAKAVGKSRPSVANTLRLLELSEPVQKAIEEGKITAGHARALLMAPPEARRLIFERMMLRELSVREVENAARSVVKKDGEGEGKKADVKVIDSETKLMLSGMEKAVETSLKRKCRIKRGSDGKGRMELEFYSDRDLEGLVEKLRGN